MIRYKMANNLYQNMNTNVKPKDNTMIYIIVVVVVLILGGVGYWYYTKEDEEDEEDEEDVSVTITSTKIAADNAVTQAAAAGQAAAEAQKEAITLSEQVPVADPVGTTASGTTIDDSSEDTMAPLDTSGADMGRRITDIYSLPRGEDDVELTTPCRSGYEVVTRDAGRYKNLTFCAKFEDGPGKGLSKIGVSRGECNHDGDMSKPAWKNVSDGFGGDEAILLNRPSGHHNVLCWEESESASMNPVFQKNPKTCAAGKTMISYRRDGRNLPKNTGSFMNESNGHDYYVCGDLA